MKRVILNTLNHNFWSKHVSSDAQISMSKLEWKEDSYISDTNKFSIYYSVWVLSFSSICFVDMEQEQKRWKKICFAWKEEMEAEIV